MNKKLIFSIVIITIIFLFCGCEKSDTSVSCSKAEVEQTRQTNTLIDEAQRQAGMPNIKNFQERKLAKMIFELRDQENLVCYAYIKSDYQGKLIFIGKCIGFGLPYSVQYTSPERLVDAESALSCHLLSDSGRIQTMPQPDPNGLYMPMGLSATWLMMIDPRTQKARPVYIEPEIVVSPFPLHKEIGN